MGDELMILFANTPKEFPVRLNSCSVMITIKSASTSFANASVEEAINVLVYPATIQEITNIINQRNLYKRGDDKPVQNNQVAATINNYPLLFEINEKRHVVLKKETQLQYQRLVYQLQDLLRSHNSRHTDIIIATYIFLESQ